MTKSESLELKGIAIIFMLLLHLFNTYDYQNIYDPYLLINGTPLIFYISLFADCCVVLFLFCSGYGLYYSHKKSEEKLQYIKTIPTRLKGLYIKYWVILILFCLILAPILGEGSYPGDFLTIILNLTALDTSYNGAWWFFTTYILCLSLSPVLFKLIDEYSPTPMLLIYCCFYTVGYIQRFKTKFVLDNPVLDWLLTETALLGNSLLPFVIGAYFVKYNLVSRVRHSLESKFKQFYINFFMVISLISMFIAKTYVPTLFVAIATGVGLILCYLLIDKPVFIKKILSYLGMHSSNIWLTHMFIYLSFVSVSQYVYLSRDPIIIFSSLLIMCLGCSYVINFLEEKIQK